MNPTKSSAAILAQPPPPPTPALPPRTHTILLLGILTLVPLCYVHPVASALQAFYKSARVEWVPVGVVGAIVPWNWPFHNIINPISAAVMSGNAIVIKVTHASAYSACPAPHSHHSTDQLSPAPSSSPPLQTLVPGSCTTQLQQSLSRPSPHACYHMLRVRICLSV